MTPAPLVDGQPVQRGALARLRRRGQRLVVSRTEQEEAELERRLLSHPGVTRPNLISVMSPTGGVGKTTCTFVLANLLATHLKLRTIAVDANPEFGTLAHLTPTDRRPQGGIGDLLHDADRLHTAAELRPYVIRLTSGAHVLAGRDRTARLGPERYGELVALLSCFYEVVLLDLAPGMVAPLASFAARRADQVVLVTTPDRTASTTVLDALAHLRHHGKIIVAANRTTAAESWLRTAIAVPDDEQLAAALASRTYSLGALNDPTRSAIKRLGLAVAERLV